MAETTKRGVLLVDDHPICREGFAHLIERQDDLYVCAEASDAREAMRAIAEHGPDLAIVDISLAGASGLDLTREIRGRYPDLPVLVVSMHAESLFAERALRAGARGYVMKAEPPTVVLGAIRRVLDGGMAVSEDVTDRLLTQLAHGRQTAPESPTERLSDRQFEVFRLIGEGRATKEIAEMLHLSVKTVESHRESIKSKLSLRTGTELLRYAVQWVQSSDGVQR